MCGCGGGVATVGAETREVVKRRERERERDRERQRETDRERDRQRERCTSLIARKREL